MRAQRVFVWNAWRGHLSNDSEHRERKCADTTGTVLVPHGLAISSAEMQMRFSNETHESNFIRQHSETVTAWNSQNADDCSFEKYEFVVLFCCNFPHTFVPCLKLEWHVLWWFGRDLLRLSGVAVGWARWAKVQRAPSSRQKKFKVIFPLPLKIRTSGYQTLKCFIATLPD